MGRRVFLSAKQLPSLTRPVSCLSLWPWRVAIMPRSEVCSTSRLVFANFHIWIAKSHPHDIAVVLNVNNRLLFAVAGFTGRNPAGFIQRDRAALVLSHFRSPLVDLLHIKRCFCAGTLVRLVTRARVFHQRKAGACLHPMKPLGGVHRLLCPFSHN